MRVDSHCHVSLTWFEPVELLLFQMDRNGVDQAVLTQDAAQLDNSYLLECVRRYADRLVPVVALDTRRPDAIEELGRLAEQGATGVRLRCTARSPGDDPLAIWRAAARMGLAVSCQGFSQDYLADDFAALVETLPELLIAIEHLGSANTPDKEDVPLETRRRIFELARYPNVLMKFHGPGEFARRAQPMPADTPFDQPVDTLFQEALAAFGPDRLMWGSDYPR